VGAFWAVLLDAWGIVLCCDWKPSLQLIRSPPQHFFSLGSQGNFFLQSAIRPGIEPLRRTLTEKVPILLPGGANRTALRGDAGHDSKADCLPRHPTLSALDAD